MIKLTRSNILSSVENGTHSQNHTWEMDLLSSDMEQQNRVQWRRESSRAL